MERAQTRILRRASVPSICFRSSIMWLSDEGASVRLADYWRCNDANQLFFDKPFSRMDLIEAISGCLGSPSSS
jgi:hypothetical protein